MLPGQVEVEVLPLPQLVELPSELSSPSSKRPCIDVACAKKNELDLLMMVADRLGWKTSRGAGGTVVWVNTREETTENWRSLRDGQWLSHMPGQYPDGKSI
ncbi:unnamed protein product [Polarella glacialis]|uniref:Uncharacterized protein n=1 Tax=Polarella glacialis TaxID=89957 RepID=A0A813D7B6_POLGL|nr:unnamed protein product [Polarella glacialis]